MPTKTIDVEQLRLDLLAQLRKEHPTVCRMDLTAMTSLSLDLMDQAGMPYGICDMFPEL